MTRTLPCHMTHTLPCHMTRTLTCHMTCTLPCPMIVSRARRSEGGERLVTVVDFPCAIAECCDVQLDYSIRNNEVKSCDITSALCACASSTCTRAIQRMRYTRVDLLRHTFLVTICVTSRLMKFLVHTESRLQSPDVPSSTL